MHEIWWQLLLLGGFHVAQQDHTIVPQHQGLLVPTPPNLLEPEMLAGHVLHVGTLI